MKRQPMIFASILAIAFSCFCCKSKTSVPTSPAQLQLEIDTTFLSPNDSLWAVGGPGFYYKSVNRNPFLNPLWGDSIVQMLLDSNIVLAEFWYPADGGRCHVPFMDALEISRLNQPDTAIYRFGYVPLLDSINTTHFCILHWRHYKIIR